MFRVKAEDPGKKMSMFPKEMGRVNQVVEYSHSASVMESVREE
jgi:hypothetical protein